MQTIRCQVRWIIFQAKDSSFVIARCNWDGALITVLGDLPGVVPDMVLEVEGNWESNPTYGDEFRVSSWKPEIPTDTESIQKYLTCFIRGIGEGTARKIVKIFGTDTIRVMTEEIDRLREVPGLGKKKIRQLKREWERGTQERETMLFLQKTRMTPGLARKVYEKYGGNSISVVRDDPYQLTLDIQGVGFQTADQIALDMGLPPDSDSRIRSGLSYALRRISESGHMYATRQQLVRQAVKLLNVEESRIQDILNVELDREKLLDDGGDAIYLPDMLSAEIEIARHLHRLNGTVSRWTDLSRIEARLGIQYDDAQREAVESAMVNKVVVITGGPGTGKTTVTKGIIQALKSDSVKILLAAPTGRAAKRMNELTDRKATTIHRLLEYDPTSDPAWGRDEKNPVEGDVLIVDEVSMIDASLMHALLRALPDRMQLILIGDVDQLPSIGAGCVLRDIIDSGVFPVTRLTKIFRQAAQSRIISNCHRIREGRMPDLRTEKTADFFFMQDEDPTHIAEQIVDLVSRRLPAAYGMSAMDIQVLAPQKNTCIGTLALNAALQEKLNPAADGIAVGDTVFHPGDRVIQTANDYDKKVFNGDLGVVTSVNEKERSMVVSFEERLVAYAEEDLKSIGLAYAITIHKAQGSEFPFVILPVHTVNAVMLERHLLYTGFSRAKKLLVVIGTWKALEMGVHIERAARRNTRLKERLQQLQQEKTQEEETTEDGEPAASRTAAGGDGAGETDSAAADVQAAAT